MSKDFETPGTFYQQRYVSEAGIMLLQPINWFDAEVNRVMGVTLSDGQSGPEQQVVEHLFSPYRMRKGKTPETFLLVTSSPGAYNGEKEKELVEEYVTEILKGKTFELDEMKVGEVVTENPFTSITGELTISPLVFDPKKKEEKLWSFHRVVVNVNTGTRNILRFSTPMKKKEEFEQIARTMVGSATFDVTK